MNTVPQKPPKILLWEAVSMAAEMILALLMARDEGLFQDPDRLTTDIDQLISAGTHLALRGDSLRGQADLGRVRAAAELGRDRGAGLQRLHCRGEEVPEGPP